jgi:hypothetical protein
MPLLKDPHFNASKKCIRNNIHVAWYCITDLLDSPVQHVLLEGLRAGSANGSVHLLTFTRNGKCNDGETEITRSAIDVHTNPT